VGAGSRGGGGADLQGLLQLPQLCMEVGHQPLLWPPPLAPPLPLSRRTSPPGSPRPLRPPCLGCYSQGLLCEERQEAPCVAPAGTAPRLLRPCQCLARGPQPCSLALPLGPALGAVCQAALRCPAPCACGHSAPQPRPPHGRAPALPRAPEAGPAQHSPGEANRVAPREEGAP